MNHVRYTLPGAFVAVGLAMLFFGVAWHYRRASRTIERERALAKQQYANLTVNVKGVRIRMNHAHDERERQHAALQALQVQSTALKATPASPRIVQGPSIYERLQTEPDTQVYWLASQRSEATAKYRAFFRQAGLSAEQVEKFHDVLLKRDEQAMDVQSIIRDRGLSRPDDATGKLLANADKELEAAQRELLGDDGFRQLTEYNRTSGLRQLVNGIAGGAVVVARDPLTSQQAEQLLQLMANASASYKRGGHAHAGEIDWNAVDAQARTFLSPAQFALFSTMEPPLPVGARFQSQLYREVDRARKREGAGKVTP